MDRQFNGKRLREGRIYRGYTITDLADELDVSKQMVSKYENGKSTPSFEAIMSMTNVLKFPRGFFFEEPVEVKAGSTYFRSLLTTGKKEREMQYDRVKYISIMRALLEEYVDFPVLDVPEFEENKMDIEYVAKSLRQFWDLGDKPIKNIVQLLERKGFVITSFDLGKKNIDAFGSQQEINGRTYYTIVLGNGKKSFYRRQFDVAHELGHRILHDPYMDITDLTKEEFKQIEQEANDFAAAFLLPKEGFYRDVSMHPTDLMYYKQLKRNWGVSIGAMVMRAYKLGVISKGSYQYMQRSIGQKGWRKKEPLDDVKEPEGPVAMKQAIQLLIENDYIRGQEFIDKLSLHYGLSLHREEIENLLGLEDGYLSAEIITTETNIVNLKEKKAEKKGFENVK